MFADNEEHDGDKSRRRTADLDVAPAENRDEEARYDRRDDAERRRGKGRLHPGGNAGDAQREGQRKRDEADGDPGQNLPAGREPGPSVPDQPQ